MNLPFANKELAVQFPAIAWLERNWGYEEVKSGEDDDVLSSPIDSLGRMNGRILLVEFKYEMRAGMSRYNPNGSGSIEGKLSRLFKGIHEQRPDMIWPFICSAWDPSLPPVFVIVAGKYTDAGLEEATSLLHRRSLDWLFDFLIWQWTGYDVRQLDSGGVNRSPSIAEYKSLCIPALTERAYRRRTLSLQEHLAEVHRRGLSELFAYIIRRSGELGYAVDRTRSTIRLRAVGPNGLRDNAIGIYINWSSSQLGLNVGFYWKRGNLRVEQLPGRPAPKKGPLNVANRYIRSVEEAECALKMFAP